jgi:pimeloyl-ACP methyl ester carboxylesterase
MSFAQQGLALTALVLVGCAQEAAVESDDLGSGELPHGFHIPAEGNADQALLTELSASPEFLRGDVSAVSRYYELVFRPLMFDPDQTLKIPLDPRTARNGFGVMRALGESMPDPDYWNQLPGITAPTLIVQGSADAYPVEMAREMASALGNGRTLVLEEAGHFPYIEASAAFLEGVRAFLQTDEGS